MNNQLNYQQILLMVYNINTYFQSLENKLLKHE